MSTHSHFLAATSALTVIASAACADSPDLGRVATPEEIASWDISIGPDGAGLPLGNGTPKQGEAVYVAKCLACHGARGVGKPNDQLVGGRGTLRGDQVPSGQSGVSGLTRRPSLITYGAPCRSPNPNR